MRRWLIRTAAALALASAAVGLFVGWAWRAYVAPGPLTAEQTVIIPKGEGLSAIARRLEQEGVIHHAWVFVAGVKLSGAAIKAGEYAFTPGISARTVQQLMHEGRTVVHRLTIPEGLTVAQVIEMLNGSDLLTGVIDARPREGWLLPETYHFSRGDDRADIVARMERAMRQTMDDLWAKRAPDLPFDSPEQALVLASIVEKETGVGGERAKVAGVYVNRLRKGMKLQADPTVAYGITRGQGAMDRGLTYADLAQPSPYNTYVIDGLPPGPIANPGRAAIEAALRPAKTDALFFVADGTGGHVFAKTLDEHNRNVARWRKISRERR